MHKPPSTETAPRSRILVVDDHAVVRHGIAALLAGERDLVICGEAGTFEEAESALAALNPDIILLDITLKDRNGLDLIKIARQHDPDIRVLVLSMHDESAYAERALRAGAQGYVMKEHADDVIVDALRTVLRGEIFVSPEVASRMLRQYAEHPQGEKAEFGIEALTDREREVFAMIGEGLSTRKIAEKLGLSDRTVEVHRMHIKRKLQCEDAAQVFREAVRYAEQGGQ